VYRKMHCNELKYIYLVNYLVVFDEYTVIRFLNLEAKCLVGCFGRATLMWVKTVEVKLSL
jgi:hypothetical protein